MLRYQATLLPDVWPGGAFTAPRKSAPFRSSFSDTLALLDDELRHVGASDVELAVGFTGGHRDIRDDGGIRVDAKAGPPVVVSFTDESGQRQRYPCDTYDNWGDNIRAIALGLKALRAVERYGISARMVRAGFKALPAAGGSTPTLSLAHAAQFIARMAGVVYGDAILSDKAIAKQWIRGAQFRTHPDRGGRNEDWTLLQEAERIITAHHGGAL